MKLRRTGIFTVLVVVLLLTMFFAVGGQQLIIISIGPRLPARPPVSSPETDLQYLRQSVLSNEREATKEQFAQFERTIEQLSTVPPADAEAASIIAARAMARLQNAHSTLIDPRLRRLPIRVRWFEDGLFIVKARAEWATLVGHKLITIGGRSPEQLLENLSELAAGNTPWLRYRSEYFLVSPAAIASLGGYVKHSIVALTTNGLTGGVTSWSLEADQDVLPGDAFWEWEHQLPRDTSFGTKGWKTLLDSIQQLPLYLEESTKLYLLRDLPEHDAVYVRTNGSIDDDVGDSLGVFLDKALALIRKRERKNVIVDFRFNWGGGYDKTAKFTRELPGTIPATGHVYLITGPNTFSAGLLGAARLKHFGGSKVVVVGQPVGDNLEFRAEGFLVTLPSTDIKVYLSTARHDVQHECRWLDDCYVLDKFLGFKTGSLAPDVIVHNTGESYANGEDRILETIFQMILRERAVR